MDLSSLVSCFCIILLYLRIPDGPVMALEMATSGQKCEWGAERSRGRHQTGKRNCDIRSRMRAAQNTKEKNCSVTPSNYMYENLCSFHPFEIQVLITYTDIIICFNLDVHCKEAVGGKKVSHENKKKKKTISFSCTKTSQTSQTSHSPLHLVGNCNWQRGGVDNYGRGAGSKCWLT